MLILSEPRRVSVICILFLDFVRFAIDLTAVPVPEVQCKQHGENVHAISFGVFESARANF